MEPRYTLQNGVETLVPRRIPFQNILLKIRNRELGTIRHHLSFENATYKSIVPDTTIINIEKPPCFLRKFSPCGKYLIAFTSDQTGVEIYLYAGAGSGGDLLKDVVGGENVEPSLPIRQAIFDRYFKMKHVITLTPTTEQLHRECSLFTEDGRYLITASSGIVVEDPRYPRPFDDVYRNNEAIPIHPRFSLEDITIYIIDLESGAVCDSRQFKTDKIYLAHNQGLYLYKDTLAVLSVQHQTIHVFQIGEDGRLIEVRSVGRFCHDDDEYILSSTAGRVAAVRNYREVQITGLKHKLLAFLLRKALVESADDGKPDKWRFFFKKFHHLRWLRIWKMQLLDEKHLLIKYAGLEVVTLRAAEPNSQPSFFVLYRMDTAEVLAIYENTSEELLHLFENFHDFFRNPSTTGEGLHFSSTSTNIYARELHNRLRHTIEGTRFGGIVEATKRILAQLPIAAQSHSSSPYLDMTLFSFDEKCVSAIERPKAGTEHPLRFYGRDSGLYKFSMVTGIPGRSIPQSARRLVAFIFHPTDPFAITVQRTSSDYTVNFHVRCAHGNETSNKGVFSPFPEDSSGNRRERRE